MNRATKFFLLAIALAPSAWGAAGKATKAPQQISVVRVNVTNQPFDFVRPWSKRAPYSRRALGAVLANHEVLVTAELVANANYVELEKAESGEKVVAIVDAVDYEANLALLKPTDDKFIAALKPLELKHAVVGDRVIVWQLENTGALLATEALLTTVEVSRYPVDDTALLIYRLTSSLQYREGSFTLPVVKDGKLVGLLMRYDTRTQNVDLIPTPVIEHFLREAGKKTYGGFPRAGVLFAPTRDPQLRRYAGLTDKTPGGVYVTEVQRDSPAAKAGLKVGDVILALGDKAVDQDGNYTDPIYGKVSLVHLISTSAYPGDVMKCQFARKGEVKTIDLTLAHRAASDYVIPPYNLDEAPRYFVLGGLILQELSRQYLKEWGLDWTKKAPERFVYLDRYQTELFHDKRKKIVVLSQVLPSGSTLGYEQLAYLVVTKINGVELNSLDDVPIALQKPIDGFHKIEFDEAPHEIFLEADQVEKDNAALMHTYGLPSVQNLQ